MYVTLSAIMMIMMSIMWVRKMIRPRFIRIVLSHTGFYIIMCDKIQCFRSEQRIPQKLELSALSVFNVANFLVVLKWRQINSLKKHVLDKHTQTKNYFFIKMQPVWLLVSALVLRFFFLFL